MMAETAPTEAPQSNILVVDDSEAIRKKIKAILKQPGEAVRNAEPVLQVQNLCRLRVEGLVDVQHLPRLREGMQAVIEPTRVEGPALVLKGHLQAGQTLTKLLPEFPSTRSCRPSRLRSPIAIPYGDEPAA